MRGVKSLTPLATSLVILTMVVAVGGIMLTQFQPASYINNEDTETITSSGSVPETIQVSDVGVGLDKDSETIKLYDNATETNYTLDQGDDYTVVSYETGEFEIQEADVDGDGTNEIDSTGDEYHVEYVYNTEGTASNIIDQGLSALDTFGSFFTVIIVVGIGAVLLLLLQVFRTAGAEVQGQSMA